METPQRKLVFAPFGSNMFGDDIHLFEHTLLFAMETLAEATGFAYADIHEKAGGQDKRERPTPPLTENEIRTLADRAVCDALIDGSLLVQRDLESKGLSGITVALRVFLPQENRFEIPEAWVFDAFPPNSGPEDLQLDYDKLLSLQLQVGMTLLDILDSALPADTDAPRPYLEPNTAAALLRVTNDWEAAQLFLKGKRVAKSPETKLGYYEQALLRDPKFFWAHYNSAMLFKTQTDYHSARNRLMRAATATKDEAVLADVYFELGLVSIYLGDPKTARNFWQKALEFGQENPTLYVNMAGTYEQEENWAEAIRLNELVLERWPDHYKAIVNLARLHAMFGRLNQAIPLYEQAVELQPKDALRHAVLGGCYLANERMSEARREFTIAVQLDPESDPGKYAQQELDKLGPERKSEPSDGEDRPKRGWKLW